MKGTAAMAQQAQVHGIQIASYLLQGWPSPKTPHTPSPLPTSCTRHGPAGHPPLSALQRIAKSPHAWATHGLSYLSASTGR